MPTDDALVVWKRTKMRVPAFKEGRECVLSTNMIPGLWSIMVDCSDMHVRGMLEFFHEKNTLAVIDPSGKKIVQCPMSNVTTFFGKDGAKTRLHISGMPGCPIHAGQCRVFLNFVHLPEEEVVFDLLTLEQDSDNEKN